MKHAKRTEKSEMQVLLVAFLFCAVLAIVALFAYGPRLSTNDDVVIKALLNGDITGVGESHMINGMFLLGVFYKALYSVFKGVAWYDECSFALHILIYFLFLFRGGQLTAKKSVKWRIAAVLAAGLFFCLLDFKYLVIHQYTILAAETGALGIFYAATLREEDKRDRIKDFIITGILILLCLLIRKEVFYMVLPLFGIAFLFRFLKKADLSKVAFLFVMALAILTVFGIEKAAYSSAEWRNFQEIHSERIQIYDYYRLPSYDRAKEEYEAVGVAESDLYPLGEWDLGLFEDYFEGGMKDLAALCKVYWEKDNAIPLTKIWGMKYIIKKIFEKPLFPAGWILFLGFPVALGLLLWKKKWKSALFCFGAFAYMAVFSAYFIYRERFPERVSYGLYLMTICLILGIVFSSGMKMGDLFPQKLFAKKKNVQKDSVEENEDTEKAEEAGKKENRMIFSVENEERIGTAGIIATAVLFLLLLAGVTAQLVNTGGALKEIKNRDADWDAMNAYFTEHPENMYYLKTSTVASFGEKMFTRSTYEKNNYVRLGAWFARCPIQERYLSARGDETWLRIRRDNHVYLVEADYAGTDWIEAFYAGHGIDVTVEISDTILLPSGRKILIVSIKETEES